MQQYRLYVEQYRLIQDLCGGTGVVGAMDVVGVTDVVDITDIVPVTDVTNVVLVKQKEILQHKVTYGVQCHLEKSQSLHNRYR